MFDPECARSPRRGAPPGAWLGAWVALGLLCTVGSDCSGEQDATANPPGVPRADAARDTSADVAPSHEASSCVPATCAQIGAQCGNAPDACGGIVSCGACASGQTCGGAGPNLCGTGACTPKTCLQLQLSCGVASDGCGDVVSCGDCAPPLTCGGGGDPKSCGCMPKTCATLGIECGTADDACGGALDCGGCASGQSCENGACKCLPPTVSCGTGCVDTTNDPSNCGACFTQCPGGLPCVGGKCSDPCANNFCSDHGWCEAGACLCDPGYAGTDCSSCDGVWTLVPGSSPPACQPTNAIDGTAAGEAIDGTSGADLLRGLDGNDTLRGLDGNDYVNGNVGNDQVNGNTGRDAVYGGSGDDIVMGGADNDYVMGGIGVDQVLGDEGDDRLEGGPDNDTLDGGNGNDHYMIDGLGNDTFDDPGGTDAARCKPGVTITADQMIGADRKLTLSTGGTVLILGNRVEAVLGCN